MAMTLIELKALDHYVQEGIDRPLNERRVWFDALEIEPPTLRPLLALALFPADAVESGTFMGTVPKISMSERAPIDLMPGDEIGPYTLSALIGEGGSATVWRAQRSDGTMKRDIALKLPHFVGNSNVWAERIERERDVLASLQHPNIATIYDAGIAANGRPWLALEWVDGDRIDRYVQNHDLASDAIVKVFLPVIYAIEHAHARGVIHRDVKPQNILVVRNDRGETQAKLLDFGIAKLQDQSHASELTQLHGRPFTPEYASLEQLRGDTITTATDVYSLGVVLYELLCGRRPLQSNEHAQSLRQLETRHTEITPLPPSARLREGGEKLTPRTIASDLDAIALKAVHRDPQKQYANATAFSEDLQRYLANEPVGAQPDSALYRGTRFIQRHKVLVLSAAAVAASLLVGTGVSIWQARAAIQQRDRADAEATLAKEQQEIATEARKFLVEALRAADVNQFDAAQKRKQTLEQFIDVTTEKIKKTPPKNPLLNEELLTTLAEIQRGVGYDLRALELYERVLQSKRSRSAMPFDTAATSQKLAYLTGSAGKYASAITIAKEAIATLPPQSNKEEATTLAKLDSLIGLFEGRLFNFEQSDAYTHRAMKQFDALGIEIDERNLSRYARAWVLLHRDGDSRGAARLAKDVVAAADQINGIKNTTERMYLAAYQSTALQWSEAYATAQEALQTLDQTTGRKTYHGVRTLTLAGRTALLVGDFDRAIAYFNEAEQIFETMRGEAMFAGYLPSEIVQLKNLSMFAHFERGDFSQSLRKSAELNAIVGQEDTAKALQRQSFHSLRNIGLIDVEAGRYDIGLAHLKRALAIISPKQTGGIDAVNDFRAELAWAHYHAGQTSEALALIETIAPSREGNEKIASGFAHAYFKAAMLRAAIDADNAKPEALDAMTNIKALVVSNTTLDPAHRARMLRDWQDSYANALLALKQNADARQQFTERLTALSKQQTSTSHRIFVVRVKLAIATARDGEIANARKFFATAKLAFTETPEALAAHHKKYVDEFTREFLR
jgi:serine/threonine protein kinase